MLFTAIFLFVSFDILCIKLNISGNSVNCRLFNDSLTIVVNTREDLFEIGDVKPPINQSQSIQAFYRELNIIFKIIDYLVENNEDITM